MPQGVLIRCAILLACWPWLAIGQNSLADEAADDVDRQMTERIDQLLVERWQAAGIEPAPLADDANFLRRLHLDLTGVIPHVADVQEFLADEIPNKRRELIDRLLVSPGHYTHMADVWRDLMLPRKFDPQQTAGLIGLQNWLRRQFVDNRRYDRIVAALVLRCCS
jgi:hypothetical protein